MRRGGGEAIQYCSVTNPSWSVTCCTQHSFTVPQEPKFLMFPVVMVLVVCASLGVSIVCVLDASLVMRPLCPLLCPLCVPPSDLSRASASAGSVSTALQPTATLQMPHCGASSLPSDALARYAPSLSQYPYAVHYIFILLATGVALSALSATGVALSAAVLSQRSITKSPPTLCTLYRLSSPGTGLQRIQRI